MKQEPDNNKNNYVHLFIGIFMLLFFFGIFLYLGKTEIFFVVVFVLLWHKIAHDLTLSSNKIKRIISYIMCPYFYFDRFKFFRTKAVNEYLKKIETEDFNKQPPASGI
jgi:hypothetical protein